MNDPSLTSVSSGWHHPDRVTTRRRSGVIDQVSILIPCALDEMLISVNSFYFSLLTFLEIYLFSPWYHCAYNIRWLRRTKITENIHSLIDLKIEIEGRIIFVFFYSRYCNLFFKNTSKKLLRPTTKMIKKKANCSVDVSYRHQSPLYPTMQNITRNLLSL